MKAWKSKSSMDIKNDQDPIKCPLNLKSKITTVIEIHHFVLFTNYSCTSEYVLIFFLSKDLSRNIVNKKKHISSQQGRIFPFIRWHLKPLDGVTFCKQHR